MEKAPDHFFLLVLCGGGGTRLWPRSRNQEPKQFSKLLNERSLIQITYDRFKKFLSPEKIFVVTTTQRYAKIVRNQLPRIPKDNIIVEPMRRNTAMAHGLGAVYIKARDPEAVILNEYSDHIVHDVKDYLKTYTLAGKAAAEGNWLVAIGIKPAFPHTGMGHIKARKTWKKIGARPIYRVEGFTEKPDYQKAKKFTETGYYYWNAGLYVWKASTYLQAIKKHEPRAGKSLVKIEQALGTKDEQKVVKQAYQVAPDIAVDYAVSEKAKNFLMIEANFDWVDIGDWEIVYQVSKKDNQGNVVIKHGKRGEFIGVNTKDSLIHFDDQLIATVDVEGLIIVDTKDALLICPREKAEEVKKFVQKIKKLGKREYL
jgi:mannose-1-phosphate guanylyltransferase